MNRSQAYAGSEANRRQSVVSGGARVAGFTLMEAVIATSITAIAGSALLLGVSTGMQTSNDVLNQTIANGVAQQLVDEAAGRIYCAVGADPQDTFLGPNSTEAGGNGRERYNDIDDYNGFTAKPIEDEYGYMLGTDDGQGGQRHVNFRVYSGFFNNWRESIEVYYVNNSNLSQRLPTGQTSNYRALEAHVYYDDPVNGTREIGNARRVFAYVPAN
jgi:type II secretory pathway pseudopilin PulG